MHPSTRELMATPSPERRSSTGAGLRRSTPRTATGSARGVTRSPSHISRFTSDESWIEVASQPSSSSLSSAAPSDGAEVITTGLRVTQSGNPRRRQRLRRAIGTTHRSGSSADGGSSSQDEYDDSESGSDPNVTGSHLAYPASHARGSPLEYPTHYENDDMDEGSDGADCQAAGSDDDTALGVGTQPSPLFTPQPNAFSHPPASATTRLPPPIARAATDSYFPSHASYRDASLPTASSARAASSTATSSLPRDSSATTSTPLTSTSSMPSRRHHARNRSHTPYTLLAPSHTVPVDHDAALRASLSTLLSCAAAARGLPKREREVSADVAPPSARAPPRVEPSSFRLISESSLDAPPASDPDPAQPPPLPKRPTSPSPSSRHSPSGGSTGKRRARSPRDKDGRRTRRRLEAPDPGISPTLMTWVLGAGVMVLFSALSFSAGYALGREVARVEAINGLGNGGWVGVEEQGWMERSTAALRGRVGRWGWMSGSGAVKV